MNVKLKKTVARRIKVARAELGWNQSDLAEQLQVNQNMVSQWESGEIGITMDTLERIAQALNKLPAWFMQPTAEAISVKKATARR